MLLVIRISAGLPEITGVVGGWQMGGGNYCSGAFALSINWHGGYGGSSIAEWFYGADFYASRCSSIYGSSATVSPLSIKYLPVIKF